MGCSHATACPLFPLLKSSLQGWRDHYCDSEDRWLECARYQMSLTGERVPISLLPNGHQALHLAAEANWSGEAKKKPRRAPREEVQQEPRRTPQPIPDPQPSETWDGFEAALPPVTPRHHQPPPGTHFTEPQDLPAGRSRRAAPKRGLWARLIDWMTGPS